MDKVLPNVSGKYPIEPKVKAAVTWSSLFSIALTILSLIAGGKIGGLPAWMVTGSGMILLIISTSVSSYNAKHQIRLAYGDGGAIDSSESIG